MTITPGYTERMEKFGRFLAEPLETRAAQIENAERLYNLTATRAKQEDGTPLTDGKPEGGSQ